jgi:hypothetical protein
MNVLALKNLMAAAQKGQSQQGGGFEGELDFAAFMLDADAQVDQVSQGQDESVTQDFAIGAEQEEETFDVVNNEVVEEKDKGIEFSVNPLVILNEQVAREQRFATPLATPVESQYLAENIDTPLPKMEYHDEYDSELAAQRKSVISRITGNPAELVMTSAIEGKEAIPVGSVLQMDGEFTEIGSRKLTPNLSEITPLQTPKEQLVEVDLKSDATPMLPDVDLPEVNQPGLNAEQQAEIIPVLNLKDPLVVNSNSFSHPMQSPLKLENRDEDRYELTEDQPSGMQSVVLSKSNDLDQNGLKFIHQNNNFGEKEQSFKEALTDEMKSTTGSLGKEVAAEGDYRELVNNKQKVSATERSENEIELNSEAIDQKSSPLEGIGIKDTKGNDFTKIAETKSLQTPITEGATQIQKQQFVEQILVKMPEKVNGQDSQVIKIELHPKELGVIEVAIDYTVENKPKIEILTDKFTTYDLLQSTAQELERSLMQIGINTEAGGLNFGLRDEGQKHQNGGNEQLVQYADNQGDDKSKEESLVQVTRSDKEVDLLI